MSRREAIGWGRGIWAAREWIPEGYAAEIENAEIGPDGAVRSRRGAAVVGTAAGKNLVHGAAYVARTGCKTSVIIANDGKVFKLDAAASAPVVLGTIAPSALYDTAQYFDNLYIATGSAPAVVRSSGSACVLSVGAAGLPAPPAPTLTFTPIADSSNPTQYLNLLALVAGAGEIYGLNGATTSMEKYNIASNTWTARAAPPTPTVAGLHAFGPTGTGGLVYSKGPTTVPGAGEFDTRWYDRTTNSWSVNKPLASSVVWVRSSEVYDGQAVFGDGSTWAILGDLNLISMVAAQIVELPAGTSVVAESGLGLAGITWEVRGALVAPAGGGKFLYFVARNTSPPSAHVFRRVDLVGGASDALAVPPIPTNLVETDRLHWDPARPDKVLFFRDGDAYYEYDIPTNVWATRSWAAEGKQAIFAGLIGAAPVVRRIFFFNAAGSVDFKSQLLPGAPSGGFGTYKFQAQYRNPTGASNPSPIAQISSVPDGATITATLPPSPASAVEILWFTNPSKNDLNTIGQYQVTPASDTDVTRPADVVTVGSPPPSGTGGASTIPAAKYVEAHAGRTWWGNLVGAASDVAYSLPAEPETVDPAARISFDPNDGDEITGLASTPTGLVVFKRRSIHVWVGAPPDPPTFAVSGFQRKIAVGVGCAAPRSIAVTVDGAYFVAEKGVYFTDGRGVVRISDPIDDLLPVPPDAAAGFVDERGRYHITLDGKGFHVWDPVARRWEARLTFEAHRLAPVVAGFARPDLGKRYAVAGDRVILFGDPASPAAATDPFRLKAGPHGAGVFEEDVAAIRAFVRYNGNLNLIWESDPAASVPESTRTIALGAASATHTAMRALPTRCYGRRIFVEVRSADLTPAVVEAISLDLEPLGVLAGAP